ncbi:hypothetical protein B0A55_03903 [Friedmanniomyces simplex]|uniref:25S rRNA (uridine-N(3))-methyltransferase BMT5-like domain-containing protein n=1 Tax=Friedmanniomyces simplex TaxID=329884 RepID=A0A4U0XPA4_9PEZI|nr:hypothetical protein B0A55_03903 [Friedmanniomyces simplex]
MTKPRKRKLANSKIPAKQHTVKAGQAGKTGHASKTIPPPKPKPTIPFHAEDRILLIGEGDFSFAKCIVEHHGCYQVTATCYDSQEGLYEKYEPQAEQHTKYLEEAGQTMLYSINASALDRTKQLLTVGPQWDVIIFNFPHVGGKSKDVNRQVRFNQELLVSFFKAAIPLLAEHGTIVVTLFEGEPYDLWNIRDLARHSGLEVQRSFKFATEVYPGYSHARTLGNIDGGGGWKGEDRQARSFIFQKKGAGGEKGVDAGRGGKGGKKRKRGGDDESSDDG